MPEVYDGIQAVAEFRREQRVIASLSSATRTVAPKPIAGRGQISRTGIRRHDQHDVAEIHRLAVVVGQLAVVHHLQQDVEQVGMGLLDFVEQQHAVGILVDAIGEQAPLIEAHISGRCTDQARNGVPLHVLRHVEAQEFHAQHFGQALGHFGFADACGTSKEIAADGLFRFAKPARDSLMAADTCSMALS